MNQFAQFPESAKRHLPELIIGRSRSGEERQWRSDGAGFGNALALGLSFDY